MLLIGLIGAIGGFVGGFIAAYFVMRNNPKYFHVDEMLKDEKEKQLARAEAVVRIFKDKGVAMTDEFAAAIKELLK